MRTHNRRKLFYHIARDAFVFLLSIAFAILIVESGAIEYFARAASGWNTLAAFAAGLFFTTLLTVAPAGAVLAELSHSLPLVQVAALGALGAVITDLLLFRVVRDHVSLDVAFLIKHSKIRKLRALRQTPFMRRTLSVLGALIIASPLPDELGVALMGGAQMGTGKFILISYAMNFLGIAAIAALAGGVSW